MIYAGERPPAGAAIVDVKASRTTGMPIAVLNLMAPDAWMEIGPDGEKWSAQCFEHGWAIWTPNRREAHLEATRPEEWCDDCADLSPVDVELEFAIPE
jgi:hypothetical protein